MTTRSIRIPDEIDARLVAFAEARHTSVNSAIIRAVEEMMTRAAHQEAVTAATDEVFERRAELFERLADA
ncbi:Arc family DNA-binding protein [Actinomadura viridis]|uniref:Arc family DNA-binding protein n=1 Tax=Actinomadura viridis TaxID=58110 RepID=UPI0036844F0D